MAVGLVCIQYSLRLNVESTVHGQQHYKLCQRSSLRLLKVDTLIPKAASTSKPERASCFQVPEKLNMSLTVILVEKGIFVYVEVLHCLLSEQCTQSIFYNFIPLCINDINYNYATAAFLSALCPCLCFKVCSHHETCSRRHV